MWHYNRYFTGQCVVDETPKGWFITYIDRDPETLAREEALRKKEQMELDDEERTRKLIEEQIRRDREANSVVEVEEYRPTELLRENPEEKITVALNISKSDAAADALKANPLASKGKRDDDRDKDREKEKGKEKEDKKRKNPLAAILEEEEERRRQSKKFRRDDWVCAGIVVKVLNKKLKDGKYYKCKGSVEGVADQYTAVVRMHDTGDILKLD
eukprot:Colp12_sorted_trinity150504_noHs@26764